MTCDCVSEILAYKAIQFHQELEDLSEAKTCALDLVQVCNTRCVKFEQRCNEGSNHHLNTLWLQQFREYVLKNLNHA